MTQEKLPPLEEFNAKIVQAPLQGLLRNMDSELSRRFKQSLASDSESERRLSLLLIMVRFTRNSYEAISFLISSMDESSKRKKEFVLILPPANRQLLDLLYSVVYMMDDFPTRSMLYELSGYRQAREEFDKFYEKFGSHPKWQTYFQGLRDLLQLMEKYLSITSEQKVNPATIKRWLGPAKLKRQATKSQAFLEFLDKWIYGETSSKAHLNAAGLFSVAAFLLVDFAPENERHEIEDRKLEQFKSRHFFRTFITVLAILTEIENYCHLNCREDLAHLWALLGGYSEEASDVYKERYQAMLV